MSIYREPYKETTSMKDRFQNWVLNKKTSTEKHLDDYGILYVLGIIIVIVILFFTWIVKDSINESNKRENHLREMKTLCGPNYFATETMVAYGLYEIKCLTKDGQPILLYQE